MRQVISTDNAPKAIGPYSQAIRANGLIFVSAEPPPYSEIAAALGTSEGSIGPTRARCLKKLLDVLKKKGFS